MIGIIVATSPRGVIGVNNALPWHYKWDLCRFREITTGTTVIMGQRTWESLPRRPLPWRDNVVLTSRPLTEEAQPAVRTCTDLGEAIEEAQGPVWIIGGAQVYEAALPYADLIDMTVVPDDPDPQAEGTVLFPQLGPEWRLWTERTHPYDSRLLVRLYARRTI